MAKAITVYLTDGSTVAAASYDEGSVRDGQSSTPRRLWYKNASTASETLEDCQALAEANGAGDGVDYLELAPDVPLAVPTAPSAAAAAGSGLGTGEYKYAVTFVTATGETTAGAEASVTTTAGNQQVALTNIPTGPTGTTARKIYRTVVGGAGSYKLVTTLANNTATTYTDSTADGSLGAAAPALNTSGSAGTWQAGPLTIGNLVVGAFAAVWSRFTIPADTPAVGNPRLATLTFEEAP